MSEAHDIPPVSKPVLTAGFVRRVAAAVGALAMLSALALSIFALAYCSAREHPKRHIAEGSSAAVGRSVAASG